jgi:hypothetical protein
MVSIITGSISRTHQEDIDEVLSPAFSTLRFPPEEKGLFMRLDGCSPKDATCRLHNGEKPQSMVLSTKDVLLSLCSSERASKKLKLALKQGLDQIPIFFLPFDMRMDSSREYRVFCAPKSGRITAISQYQWHKPWKFSPHNSEGESPQVIAECIAVGAEMVQQEIMACLRPDGNEEHRLLLKQGFSFDLSYDESTGDLQLVELNVFGARSGLGSCLFNWVENFETLYGERSDEAEFRVTF